ncbi:hypothetical protein V5279_41075 [Bradyrhizobium sp. 26S5]|uniref:hypothetical protein n=1 Tax=Bradyrhizobium sp. 26S5 TaxID=3139729 RepID=UPI0030D61416
MKKSKPVRNSGRPGKPHRITRRQHDLQYVYTLDRDFPAEFKAISQLEPLKRWIDENGLDEFRIRLGATISVFRSRYQDKNYNLLQQNFSVPPIAPARSSKKKPPSTELPYFKRISEICDALKTATTSLQTAAERLRFVDITHMEQILTAARSIPNNPISMDNPWGQLSQTIYYLATMVLALQWGTGVIAGPRKRGRPAAGYVWPALELAELWAEFSGTPIKTPRQPVLGKSGHKEFSEYSTKFVHLGLKMIDPEILEAEVVTAITNARALQKQIDSISIEDAISKFLFSD